MTTYAYNAILSSQKELTGACENMGGSQMCKLSGKKSQNQKATYCMVSGRKYISGCLGFGAEVNYTTAWKHHERWWNCSFSSLRCWLHNSMHLSKTHTWTPVRLNFVYLCLKFFILFFYALNFKMGFWKSEEHPLKHYTHERIIVVF